ncbi:MAG: tRNA (adenosine(37)-N6)-threonylcarbamoyltransferase complex ATPase subunit type 1 TsaE [Clostridia bacterium]|nr:tRNA (adenosine(37)-N6)-threonylcarbamoyltransferase complex ATPase subunit type 1 TsaE [Clostridia bacterium]
MIPTILSGMIEHGEGKGRLAGFPTANLHTENTALPAYGVYASVLIAEDGELRHGVTNIGTRPTADRSERPTVETWLPGFEGDLYGQKATVVLLQYIRSIHAFADMAALKRQIDCDAEKAASVTEPFIAMSLLSRDAAMTRENGQQLAPRLQIGDVLTLTGPLGAGKSEFARGIARGLGIEGTLPSPTFTILNVYENGRIPLYHYDWYRIEDPEELLAIGAEEHLPGNGVTLVEWSEQAPELLPEERLDVQLIKLDDGQRLICFKAIGGFRPIEGWLAEMKEKC